MKKLILTLILTFALGGFMQTEAQTNKEFKLLAGKQRAVSGTNLTIKFVSLIEDSRCPEGVNCIWAGNARIKVQVKSPKSGGWQTFEMNTNAGPKGDTLDGYAINLVSLTPTPKANTKIDGDCYTATFSVSRLTR
ncbi:MAG: hypothetical protein ACR2HG_13340 [Pyrinomonadaceae bacterium]